MIVQVLLETGGQSPDAGAQRHDSDRLHDPRTL
jgi:hypothetical protein